MSRKLNSCSSISENAEFQSPDSLASGYCEELLLDCKPSLPILPIRDSSKSCVTSSGKKIPKNSCLESFAQIFDLFYAVEGKDVLDM